MKQREYPHTIFDELFPLSKGVGDIHECFLYKFPLHITAIFSRCDVGLQEAVNLIACAALRAKGHRISLTCADEFAQERQLWATETEAFFESIGETNIVISSDLAPQPQGSSADIIIYSPSIHLETASQKSPIVLIFADCEILRMTRSERDAFSSFLSNQIIHRWHRLLSGNVESSSDIPATPHESKDRMAMDEAISVLIHDVRSRKRYKPEIPEAVIDLEHDGIMTTLADPDTMSVFLRVTGEGTRGVKMDHLSSVVDGSYPRLLRAVKRLIESRLVSVVSDRCVFARAVCKRNISTVEGSDRFNCSPRLGTSSPPTRIQLFCYFPSGSFGYDLDDDEKCTAVRMVKAGLAEYAKLPPEGCIVLDPSAEEVVSDGDLNDLVTHGACLIDTPWYRLPAVIIDLQTLRPTCKFRRLETPQQTNGYYSSSTKISTAAAATFLLHFLGCIGQRDTILDLFEWGKAWKNAMMKMNPC